MKPLLVGRSGVTDVTATVAAYSYVGLLSVGQKSLQHAQARAVLAKHGGGFIGEHLLVGASLDKFADPEAACVARRFARGQRVVGADHFIAISHVRPRAKKQRTVVLHVLEEVFWIAGHDLDVLRSDAVGLA